MSVDAAMKFVGELPNGHKVYWADDRFEQPGIHVWNGSTHDHYAIKPTPTDTADRIRAERDDLLSTLIYVSTALPVLRTMLRSIDATVGEEQADKMIQAVQASLDRTDQKHPAPLIDAADRREAVARIINDGQGDPKHDRPSAGNAAWAKALKKTDAILSLIAEQPVSQAAFDAAADWHDNGGAELIARGAQSRPYAEFRAEVMGKVSGAPVEAMVMAPVEPTEAMTEAGCVFIPGPRSAAKAARVWSAMIGARPGADA